MTALAKARPSSVRAINRDRRPMQASTKAFKGGLAACLAGFYGPATGNPLEIVKGRFYEDVDNSAGLDGAKLVDIQFFHERNLLLLNNDTGVPVVVADREHLCSVLDDQTARGFDGTNKSDAGIVYDVVAEGVWVEIDGPAGSPDASNVPNIQKGTTTLVAGTKSVTGVKLTAASIIQVTLRDPGAGAITGMGALSTPVASRNVGAGSFSITAVDDSKATIATAVCTVDWLIIG